MVRVLRMAACQAWRWGIVLLVLALACCGGGYGKHAERDTGVSYGMADEEAWNAPYEAAVTTEAEPMPASAPGSLERGKMLGSLASLNQATVDSISSQSGGQSSYKAINIDNWFIPKAYAAETTPDERYLVRNADLSLAVDNYDSASAQVSAVAEKHHGITTDSSMEKYGDGTRIGWVTVRIPSEDFFAAWEELKQIGEVTNQQVTCEDASNQYISTVSRLKVLQTEQETLEAMLANALEVQRNRGLGEAYSVLLQTQQRLSEVNYEIQNNEDQLSQLADRINRSTIKVNISERAAYQSEEWNWGYGETLAGAKKDLMFKWRWFVQGVIYFFVCGWTSLIPWAIIFVIGWVIYKRVSSKRRQARRAASVRPAPALPEEAEPPADDVNI